MNSKKQRKAEGSRGTYVRQACNHCRRRKSKCDGQEPVCGPCKDSGRADECSWGKETAKKARTQQHFESLVNHIKALETRVKELEGELGRGGEEGDGSSPHASSSQGGDSVLPKLEPTSPLEEQISEQSGEDSDIERLIAPTRNLVLRETDLELYGPTSAYNLAPDQPSKCSCPEDKCPHGSRGDHIAMSPYIDWNRHLPTDAPISREEHDHLLDCFFKFFSPWCMRTIPELFIRDMHRTLGSPAQELPHKTAHYSPMLHNSILCLALAFSDNPAIRDEKFRDIFATEAKSFIDADCEKPEISALISFSLISSYHASKGELGLGFLYFGMSARVGQALGIAADCSAWVKSGLIKEADATDRNWAYWTTVTQVPLSITFHSLKLTFSYNVTMVHMTNL